MKVLHAYFGEGSILKEKNLEETIGRMLYVQFKSDKIWVDEKNIQYTNN